MFVYQNKDGHLCVTFESNRPVESPEFVFAIDEAAKAIYSVVGTVAKMPEKEETEDKAEVVAKVPTIEVLDDVVENDDVDLNEAPLADTSVVKPADEREREDVDGIETDSADAPMTKADNIGAPAIEVLDAIAENDDTDFDEAPMVGADVEDEATPDEVEPDSDPEEV